MYLETILKMKENGRLSLIFFISRWGPGFWGYSML